MLGFIFGGEKAMAPENRPSPEALEQAREKLNQWKIWSENFLRELNAVKDDLPNIKTPADLQKHLLFGYSQFSTIFLKTYDHNVGKMGDDVAKEIKILKPQINTYEFWHNIPCEFVGRADYYMKDGEGSRIPTEEETKRAIAKTEELLAKIDEALWTK